MIILPWIAFKMAKNWIEDGERHAANLRRIKAPASAAYS